MTTRKCQAGDLIIRRHEIVQTAMQRDTILSDTIITSDVSKLACAQNVTIRARDDTFADLLALLDPGTLACLLAESIAVPETSLIVPWNGALDAQLEIVAVDSATTFSDPKRIAIDTIVEIAANTHQRRSLNQRHHWYDAVVHEYPEQEAAVVQLLDLIAGQYAQRACVGVVVTGSDADPFVDRVARHSGLPVDSIAIADLFSAERGRAERRLEAAFDRARRAAPAIVVVRDLHLLQNSGQGERLRIRLEQRLDDLQLRSDGVVVVLAPSEAAASSLPASLRRSLRLDHVVPLRNLDRDGRRAVLASMMDGDQYALGRVADKAHGFARSDLQRLCTEAALMALGRDDVVVRDDDLDRAADRIRPSCLDDRLRPSRPSRPLSTLADIDDALARIRSVIITPLQNPRSYRRLGIRPPRGVLLFGPSGVGKTTVALGIAAEANAAVVEARGCDLISAVVGESEKAIRDLFQKARALAPVVVVLDQVETLAPRRDRDRSQTYDRVLSCLLTELDGVTSRAPEAPLVFVIGTTSFRERMDEAILRPGRFDEQIELGLPDRDGRRAILRAYCQTMPIADDVDLNEIAIRTSGYSGADLQGICIEAGMNALRRDLQAAVVTNDDFRGVPNLR